MTKNNECFYRLGRFTVRIKDCMKIGALEKFIILISFVAAISMLLMCDDEFYVYCAVSLFWFFVANAVCKFLELNTDYFHPINRLCFVVSTCYLAAFTVFLLSKEPHEIIVSCITHPISFMYQALLGVFWLHSSYKFYKHNVLPYSVGRP